MSIKPEEIRSMSREEKLKLLDELRAELIKLKTQAAMGTLDKPHRIRIVKKNIARILTILREEEIKGSKQR